MKRIAPAEVVRRVTRSSFVRVRPGRTPETVSTRWIGYLVLESLSAHRRARRDGRLGQFGSERRPLDAVLKALLESQVSGGPRSRRVRNLNAILDAWERRRGPRHRLTRRLVGRTPAHRYLRHKSRAKFGDAAEDMLRRKVGTRKMVPAGVALCSGVPAGYSGHRDFSVWLRSIRRTAGHATDDAVYFLTASALTDATGTWHQATNCMTGAANGIDDGHAMPIPDEARTLCDWRMMLPDEAGGAGTTGALCIVALMQDGGSHRERVYGVFRAAVSAGRVLASRLQREGGGAVGVATAVVGVLARLLLALDDDDELATAVYRFDGVLQPHALGCGDRELNVAGARRDGDYAYLVGIRYSGTDVYTRGSIECAIAGPGALTLDDAGPSTQGRYEAKIVSLSEPVPVDSIRWTVAPPRAEILKQGRRETAIRFTRMGDYVINVSAEIEGSTYLSYFFLPRAMPSNTLAYPFLK